MMFLPLATLSSTGYTFPCSPQLTGVGRRGAKILLISHNHFHNLSAMSSLLRPHHQIYHLIRVLVAIVYQSLGHSPSFIPQWGHCLAHSLFLYPNSCLSSKGTSTYVMMLSHFQIPQSIQFPCHLKYSSGMPFLISSSATSVLLPCGRNMDSKISLRSSLFYYSLSICLHHP